MADRNWEWVSPCILGVLVFATGDCDFICMHERSVYQRRCPISRATTLILISACVCFALLRASSANFSILGPFYFGASSVLFFFQFFFPYSILALPINTSSSERVFSFFSFLTFVLVWSSIVSLSPCE